MRIPSSWSQLKYSVTSVQPFKNNCFQFAPEKRCYFARHNKNTAQEIATGQPTISRWCYAGEGAREWKAGRCSTLTPCRTQEYSGAATDRSGPKQHPPRCDYDRCTELENCCRRFPNSYTENRRDCRRAESQRRFPTHKRKNWCDSCSIEEKQNNPMQIKVL